MVERLLAEAARHFGPIDIFGEQVTPEIVNAFSPIRIVFTEVDEFHRHFNINVLGVLLSIREALKHFAANGGSIINISSVVSRLARYRKMHSMSLATQKRRGRHNPLACEGTWPEKHPGQSRSIQASWKPRDFYARRRHHRQRVRAAGGAADPTWPGGTTGGYRGVAVFLASDDTQLDDRRDPRSHRAACKLRPTAPTDLAGPHPLPPFKHFHHIARSQSQISGARTVYG